MTITTKMREVATLANSKFVYRSDPKNNDKWDVMTGDTWRGDCDDYARTVGHYLTGKSTLKFLRAVLRGDLEFWSVYAAHNGENHLILKYNGMYIDNIQRTWTASHPHETRYRSSIFRVIHKMIGRKKTLFLGIALAVSAVIMYLTQK